MNLSNTGFFGKLVVKMKKNSPQILTGLSIFGIGLTGVTSFKAGRKTEREFMANPPIDKKDEYRRIAKNTIVPIASGLLSAGSMATSTKISADRTAAFAGLYAGSQELLQKYSQKVVEQVGENKAQEIQTQAVQEIRQSQHPLNGETIIEETGHGSYICYDEFTGRYFYSNRTYLENVANVINKRLVNEYAVSLNEVFGEMGLQPTDVGYDLGFTTDRFVEFIFTDGHVSDYDQRPCCSVSFVNKPIPEYNYFR